MFYRLIKPNIDDKVLDIGAEINPDGSQELQLIDSYPWKDKLTALNIPAEQIKLIKQHYPEIEAIIGNGCALPWPDKHFDMFISKLSTE